MAITSRPTENHEDTELILCVLNDLVQTTDGVLSSMKLQHHAWVPDAWTVQDYAEVLSDRVLEIAGTASAVISDNMQLNSAYTALSYKADMMQESIDELDDALVSLNSFAFDNALDAASQRLIVNLSNAGYGAVNAEGTSVTVSATPIAQVKAALISAIETWVKEKTK